MSSERSRDERDRPSRGDAARAARLGDVAPSRHPPAASPGQSVEGPWRSRRRHLLARGLRHRPLLDPPSPVVLRVPRPPRRLRRHPPRPLALLPRARPLPVTHPCVRREPPQALPTRALLGRHGGYRRPLGPASTSPRLRSPPRQRPLHRASGGSFLASTGWSILVSAEAVGSSEASEPRAVGSEPSASGTAAVRRPVIRSSCTSGGFMIAVPHGDTLRRNLRQPKREGRRVVGENRTIQRPSKSGRQDLNLRPLGPEPAPEAVLAMAGDGTSLQGLDATGVVESASVEDLPPNTPDGAGGEPFQRQVAADLRRTEREFLRPEDLTPVTAAAQFLGVSVATVHNAINAGKLRYHLFGTARRIRPEDLHAYAAGTGGRTSAGRRGLAHPAGSRPRRAHQPRARLSPDQARSTAGQRVRQRVLHSRRGPRRVRAPPLGSSRRVFPRVRSDRTLARSPSP